MIPVRTVLTLCAALLVAAPAVAGLPQGVELLHYERLLPVAEQRSTAERPGIERRMTFHAYGRTFELELTHSALGGAPRAGLQLYRGRLAGEPDSWVRLSEQGGMLTGLLSDGRELYAIEPAGTLLESDALGGDLTAATPLMFRLADLLVAPGTFTCATGHDETAPDGATAYQALASELSVLAARAGPGATQRIDVGVVGDFEWVTSFGGSQVGAESAMLDRMNIADGIFSDHLQVELSVPLVQAFATPNDPFTPTTDPQLLLDEVGSYKFGSATRRALGLLHLYTGRQLNGQTVGIAYRGTLCHAQFGAALTERQSTATIDALIAAHEIGHNFGAIHDGDSQFDPNIGRNINCSGVPLIFLMAPSVNGSFDFSQCSIDTMADYIALPTSFCLESIGSADGTVVAAGTTFTATIDVPRDVAVTVANNGGETLDGVMVTLTAHSALQLASVTPAGCSLNGNVASCDLGSIAGQSAATITLRLQSAQLGTFDIDVDIASSNDSNPNNDTGTVLVQVVPVSSGGGGGGGGGAPAGLLLIFAALIARARLCNRPLRVG